MEWYVVGIGILVLLVVFIGIGLPIPFALAAASLPFLWAIQPWSTSLVSAPIMLEPQTAPNPAQAPTLPKAAEPRMGIPRCMTW